MEYVLAVVAVLLVVGLGVTVGVAIARRAARAGDRTAADRGYGAGAPGSDLAIVAPDRDSPVGDTTEHAGRQRDGETVAGQDAERSGGSARPVTSGPKEAPGRHRPHPDESRRSARPVVGGEGEGTRARPGRS